AHRGAGYYPASDAQGSRLHRFSGAAWSFQRTQLGAVPVDYMVVFETDPRGAIVPTLTVDHHRLAFEGAHRPGIHAKFKMLRQRGAGWRRAFSCRCRGDRGHWPGCGRWRWRAAAPPEPADAGCSQGDQQPARTPGRGARLLRYRRGDDVGLHSGALDMSCRDCARQASMLAFESYGGAIQRGQSLQALAGDQVVMVIPPPIRVQHQHAAPVGLLEFDQLAIGA